MNPTVLLRQAWEGWPRQIARGKHHGRRSAGNGRERRRGAEA